MTHENVKEKSTYEQLIVWCIATPILGTWLLVSFLPLFTAIGAWGDPMEVLVALAFLASSGISVLAAAIGYRLATWNRAGASNPPTADRTRWVLLLSAYALVWMTLYAV